MAPLLMTLPAACATNTPAPTLNPPPIVPDAEIDPVDLLMTLPPACSAIPVLPAIRPAFVTVPAP
jgi:hypothetical protein